MTIKINFTTGPSLESVIDCDVALVWYTPAYTDADKVLWVPVRATEAEAFTLPSIAKSHGESWRVRGVLSQTEETLIKTRVGFQADVEQGLAFWQDHSNLGVIQ